jgi:hypothetical protein
MAEIIDLDEFVGGDKQVRLRGKVYRLPPDLPAELYLQINHYAQEHPDAGEVETIEKLYEQALALFRYGDPNLKSLPIGVAQVFNLVARVYGTGSQEAPEEARPPQPSRSGGATKTGSSRTRANRSR